jgi:hypothetical protein
MNYYGWIAEFGGKSSKGFFRRNIYCLHDENYLANKWVFIKQCDNTDVYECAYKYEDTNYDTCRMIGEPYLDFDIDDIEKEENYRKLVRAVKYAINYIENALGIPAGQLKLYFSGKKGFHVIIPGEIVGIVPSNCLNDDFKHFALGMAFLQCGRDVAKTANTILDTGIYDRKRLFRIVNSINSKSNLRKVPITVEQLYEFSYEDMKEWASKPHIFLPKEYNLNVKAKRGYKSIIEVGREYVALRDGVVKRHSGRKIKLKEGEVLELLPCTKNLLETGAIKGSRNHALFALASSLAQSGYKPDDIYAMADDWNGRNEEPLSEREIQTTVNSAINSYESGMTVGCGKYRDLGYCQKNCKLLEG